MKIKIRQNDTSLPQDDDLPQMGDWLAALGDDNTTKPPGDDHAEPEGTDDPASPETGPDQRAATPSPAPGNPPTAPLPQRPRPLEVAQCALCGIALPLGLLVPDGGHACADVRWYCKDAMSCTKRWTTAQTPGHADKPAAADDAVAGSREAVPSKASAERMTA